MNNLELSLGFDVLQILMTAVVGIYIWLSNRSQVTVERIQKLETIVSEEANAQNQRLSRIEEQLTHVGKMHGDVRELAGKVDGLAKTHQLVIDQMLKRR